MQANIINYDLNCLKRSKLYYLQKTLLFAKKSYLYYEKYCTINYDYKKNSKLLYKSA